jgi:hypothetical protein
MAKCQVQGAQSPRSVASSGITINQSIKPLQTISSTVQIVVDVLLIEAVFVLAPPPPVGLGI